MWLILPLANPTPNFYSFKRLIWRGTELCLLLSHPLRGSCTQQVLTLWGGSDFSAATWAEHSIRTQTILCTYHPVWIQGTRSSSSPNATHLCSFSVHHLYWALITPPLAFHSFPLQKPHITSTHSSTNTPLAASLFIARIALHLNAVQLLLFTHRLHCFFSPSTCCFLFVGLL